MHMAMVLTMLWSGGASHHSLSSYVTSFFAAKSRSSHRAQSAFTYCSELVVCLRKQRLSLICALAYILGPVALGYLERSWNPHPLRSTLIGVCLCNINGVARCRDSSSNNMCHINNQCMEKYPCTTYRKMVQYPISKNPLIKFQQKIPMKIPKYWKMVSYAHVVYYFT